LNIDDGHHPGRPAPHSGGDSSSARGRRASAAILLIPLLTLVTAGVVILPMTRFIGANVVHADPGHPECFDEAGNLVECAGDDGDAGDGEESSLDPVPGEPVGPVVESFAQSANMTPLGYSRREVPFSGAGSGALNSDLAFWGNYAYQGHYTGFRIIDISNPANPVQILNYADCTGGQGDVVVWENLLIRSWDAPASSTARCAGELVGTGFEGLHIFDISNPAAPVLLKHLRMASNTTPAGCGSHTATLVPDVARGNLYVYNSASSASCPGIDIVRVPLADPAAAVFVRREPAGRACHDTGVVLGDVNLVACAGGNGFSVFSIDPTLPPNETGGIEDPVQLYSRSITGVSIGHSAAFTYDGEVIVFGHEPGGGGQARCQATSSEVDKSIFFFGARTGTLLGTFQHVRAQTNTENCTWHNYNIVPTNRGYAFVSGNYQAGISVVDFTNPAAAVEIAYADPAPLSNTSLVVGGDWATYWYNGHVYQSDIRRGLITWQLDDRLNGGIDLLTRLNPQTQEFSFALDRTPPTVVVTGVAAGGVYTLGDVPTAGCLATDGESGVAQEPTAATSGPSSGVGTFTVTCSGAMDYANNTAVPVTATYTVEYGGVSGFLPPIADHGTVFRRGQVVPGKFSVSGDEPTGFPVSAWTIQKVSADCSTLANGAASAVDLVSPIRYDPADDQYLVIADFRSAPLGCWRLRVRLDSGQTFDSGVFRIR
jgi:hypothetical protein